MEKVIKIEGMTCQHCVNTVKRALYSVEGVSHVEVSLEDKLAKVSLEKDVPFEELKKAVESFGYKVVGEV
ncbi:heavy-metal-associated domain-containing protein [Thermocrinis minervae]|uniref:Copper chaperone n=1 Tax=Thermocrinis minervae TaxID=381751 RepID=A0A1M6TF05_9AQUI|nr:heavy metal-associated domain-containing protein [Thermocrinis minervae]SHK55540.1 copper chaperone [Thermocrinis minervae]